METVSKKSRRAGVSPEKAAGLLLLLAALAVMGKTLFVGLEIDEEYSLSIAYRLARGDSLFYTMWEPHQLSALSAAGLIALFMKVTGGTTGVLLFVRAVMLALKALLAVWFYREFRPRIGVRAAYLAALVVFVYTPKWFLGPDYISQQFHFTLAAFLCFYDYYTHGFRRPWQMLAGAFFFSLSILAFPQSVFAAPVVLIGMVLLGRRGREPGPLHGHIPRGALLLVAGCLACAAAFLLYVTHGRPIDILIQRATLILNDPQYDFTTAERMSLLLSQVASVVSFLVKPMLAALLLAVYGCVRGVVCKDVRNVRYWLNVFLAAWSLFAILLCIFRAMRDSSLDERYFTLVLVLAGLWFFRCGRGSAREPLFWLGYLPGVVAYLFILRSTLLGFSATLMYLSWPALCAVLALASQTQDADAGKENPCTPFALTGRVTRWLLLALLAFLLLCRAVLVLVTGWHEQNIFNTDLRYVATGPAACTWMDAATADRYKALELALAPHGGEKVLISTGDVDGLAFLMADGTLEVGQASVISSTDSDTRFASYYNELPEKVPDVIIYNYDCIRDLDTFHNWLEENLTITDRRDVTVGTAHLAVLTVDPPKAVLPAVAVE